MFNNQRGQSVIEVIVAVAILVIIAGSLVIAVLGSFSTARLAEEETQATLFAMEGLEATQSIRNQGWSNLANGDHGLSNSGSLWSFSGSSDTDISNKFTRVITIADAERDEDGDIVASGGTVDPETKSVVSSITWDFTPTRENTVTLTTYLTNWELARKYGGVCSGPQPTLGSEDCFVFCQGQGYTTGTCRNGVPECTAKGETNIPQGNRYCQNDALGATCCCGS